MENNNIGGCLKSGTASLLNQLQTLKLANNRLQFSLGNNFPIDLFGSTQITYVDLSGNNLAGPIVWPSSYVPKTLQVLYLHSNPLLLWSKVTRTLPPWSQIGSTYVTDASGLFSCPQMQGNTALSFELTLTVDPTYHQYSFCKCMPGSYLPSPIVSYNNITNITSSTVITPQNCTAIPTAATAINSTVYASQTVYSGFSDNFYGSNRLSLGVCNWQHHCHNFCCYCCCGYSTFCCLATDATAAAVILLLFFFCSQE